MILFNIRICFRGHGYTYIPTETSVTIKEALIKPMKLRKLMPEVCVIYVYSGITKTPISWDTEMSRLSGNELLVEQTGYWPIKLSHNFVKRQHSSLSCTCVLKRAIIPCECTRYGLQIKCMCCGRKMNSGFVCSECGFTFHKKCADGVPILCQTAKVPERVMASIRLRSGERFGNYRATPPDQLSAPAYVSLMKKESDFDEIKTSVIGDQRSKRRRTTSEPYKIHKIEKMKFKNQCSIESDCNKKVHNHKYNTLKMLHQRSSALSLISRNSFENSDCVSLETLWSNKISPSRGKLERQRAMTGDNLLKEISENTQVTPPQEEFEIPAKEIRIHPIPVGHGSFGKVYKGHWYGPVAVKVLKDTYPSGQQIKMFRNEINLLKKTRHVNVLLFMGCVCTSNNLIAIVSQWCDGSSLYNHIHVLESSFETVDLFEITVQISHGMNYLHGHDIIHRDLKSSNIFLLDDKSLIVKIGDFGLATIKTNCGDTNLLSQPEGTILWMAPEIITAKSNRCVSFKSDVYAFGIVLYELFSKQLPYSNGASKRNGEKYTTGQLEGTQIMWLVGSGQIVPNVDPIKRTASPSIKDLIMSCIEYKVDDRVSFSHIITTLENTIQNLPKASRASSEPFINFVINEH